MAAGRWRHRAGAVGALTLLAARLVVPSAADPAMIHGGVPAVVHGPAGGLSTVVPSAGGPAVENVVVDADSR